MPRFFYNTMSPDTALIDDVGIVLTDLAEVHSEAVKGARGIMAEDLLAGRPVDHQRFEVMDESGRLVMKLVFRDVLTLPGDSNSADVPNVS